MISNDGFQTLITIGPVTFQWSYTHYINFTLLTKRTEVALSYNLKEWRESAWVSCVMDGENKNRFNFYFDRI